MPRRCRGIRGDEGIAPYGRSIEVRSYNVSPSVTAFGRDTSLTEGGKGSSAPTGFIIHRRGGKGKIGGENIFHRGDCRGGKYCSAGDGKQV